MKLGGKGISHFIIILAVIIAIAAIAFAFANKYITIPSSSTAGKTSLPEVTNQTATQTTDQAQNATENSTSETVSVTVETKPKILTDHVVISEIKTAGNEFVELYNPTDSEVDVTGWWIGYYSPFSVWNGPQILTPLRTGSKIASHGFFLIGGKGYSDNADSFLSSTPDKGVLGDFGSVAIFSADIRGMSNDDAKSKKIDAVGWVAADNVVEGSPAPFPDYSNQGISLERKPGLLEPTNGNYIDTENNANDFIIRDSPEPQYTTSPIEP